jgi:hypothetical protein
VSIIGLIAWLMTNTPIVSKIDKSDEINVEKKRMMANNTMSFRYVKAIATTKRYVQGVPAYQMTPPKRIDWKTMIQRRISAKPKNLPRMNSYRAIGFERIR